jgi:NAD(P)-dependent dehydrogenase (short-subunit alcohol dehydrogenase family)
VSCVLITGAGGGLGSALARAFHRRGHALLLADLDAALVRATARDLGNADRISWSSGDIANPEHQRTLLRRAEQCFGGVEVLVNNAGITHRSLVAKTDPAVLRRVMEVDWQAPLELALAALPQLRANRGSIVAIGSMAGWMPVLGRAAYCGAKSALAQSFEVLRCEEQRHGVHVLMAYPSFLATPIERNALGHDGKPARHPRSMVGKARNADWMAERICRALERRRRRVHSDAASVAAGLLWRLMPDLYQRLMTRKFAAELDQ